MSSGLCTEGKLAENGSGNFGLQIPVGQPWRKSKPRYRDYGEQEERRQGRLCLGPASNNEPVIWAKWDGGWGLLSTVITGGYELLSQPLCFPALASTQGLLFFFSLSRCVCVCVCVLAKVEGRSLLCKKDHKTTVRPKALMLNAELLFSFDLLRRNTVNRYFLHIK